MRTASPLEPMDADAAEGGATRPSIGFAVIFAALFVLWVAMAVCVAVTFAVVAARDSDAAGAAGPTATPLATPTSRPSTAQVPLAAGEIAGDFEIGGTPPAAPAAAHVFFGYSCRDGLLTLATTRAFVYAEAPCSAITQTQVDPFYAQPVRISVDDGRLTLASATASVTVPVERKWVLVR